MFVWTCVVSKKPVVHQDLYMFLDECQRKFFLSDEYGKSWNSAEMCAFQREIFIAFHVKCNKSTNFTWNAQKQLISTKICQYKLTKEPYQVW